MFSAFTKIIRHSCIHKNLYYFIIIQVLYIFLLVIVLPSGGKVRRVTCILNSTQNFTLIICCSCTHKNFYHLLIIRVFYIFPSVIVLAPVVKKGEAPAHWTLHKILLFIRYSYSQKLLSLLIFEVFYIFLSVIVLPPCGKIRGGTSILNSSHENMFGTSCGKYLLFASAQNFDHRSLPRFASSLQSASVAL